MSDVFQQGGPTKTLDAFRSNGSREAPSSEIGKIVATIDLQQKKYQDILPSNVRWADFRNAFLIAVQGNQRLLDADRQSLWLALQKAASSGLKPDGQESALVIFGDDQEDEDGNPVPSVAKGKKKVVFMPMVAGLIKMVRNTGNVANIRAKLIYRGERVVISDEDGKETYKHVREIDADSQIDDSPHNIIGAFAVINYKDGFWELEAMTAHQIGRVRAVSRSKKGPWLTWPDEMAKKTVLRRLIKRLEKSAELRRLDDAITHDETMGTDIEGTATEITDDIKDEFTPEKQAKAPNGSLPATDPADTGGKPAAKPPAETVEKTKLAAPPAADKSPAAEDKPTPKQSDGPSDARSGFDHFTFDENDDPVVTADGQERHFTDPLDFANWFSAHAMRLDASGRSALRHHNIAAVTQASAMPEARTLIDGPKPTSEPPASDKPKGPLSLADARKQLAAITGEAELNAWELFNGGFYKGRPGASASKISQLVAEKRRVFAPPADEPDDAIPEDRDLIRARELAGLFERVVDSWQYEAVYQEAKSGSLWPSFLARVKQAGRKDLMDMVSAAEQDAYARTHPNAAAEAAAQAQQE